MGRRDGKGVKAKCSKPKIIEMQPSAATNIKPQVDNQELLTATKTLDKETKTATEKHNRESTLGAKTTNRESTSSTKAFSKESTTTNKAFSRESKPATRTTTRESNRTTTTKGFRKESTPATIPNSKEPPISNKPFEKETVRDNRKTIAKALLSSKEIEEKEMYLEKLIQSLQEQKCEEGKGEYIERIISSISNILNLEESLDLLEGSAKGSAEWSAKKFANLSGPSPKLTTLKKDSMKIKEGYKDEKCAKEEEEVEQFCAFCHALCKTRCTGCKIAYYCDRNCQKEDWKEHKHVCRSYTVAKRRDATRILVASRDLQVDDVILNEPPLVLGPRPGSAALCLACYKRLNGSYRCSNCNFPLCSRECEDGAEHALECGTFRSYKALDLQLNVDDPRQYQDAVLSLRCLISKRQDPEKWKPVLERFDQKLLEIIGSCDENSELEIALKHRFMIRSIPGFVDFSDSDIRKVLGLLHLHNIPTKLPYAEVHGIYPIASLLSHSCVPNTKLVWDNESRRLRITAAEFIAKGTPFTTIFTDILWGTRARRDHLQQTRRISCVCQRCKDPEELGTFFSAMICKRCPTRSVVLPSDPLNSNSLWECRKCSFQVSSGEVIHETLSLGAAVSEALQSPSIEKLEKLQEEWTKRFHTNHYHIHALKHSLFQLYGRRQENSGKQDNAHWEEVAKKEKACREFLKVCSLLDPGMAKTGPYVGLTFYEYHKTILQCAKRNFGLAKITSLQLRKRMLLAKELLRKAMSIFREEPEDSPEGDLYHNCQEEIIAIGKWMLAVGLC